MEILITLAIVTFVTGLALLMKFTNGASNSINR